MQNWIQLDCKRPKENQIIDFTINNQGLLLTNINNKLFATIDLCPHEEIKISLGCIKNGKLKCSLHGFSFDLNNGACDNPNVENIKTYPVKEENQAIWIKIND